MATNRAGVYSLHHTSCTNAQFYNCHNCRLAVVIISVFVVVLLYYKGIIQWRKKETKPQVVTPQTTVAVEAQLFDFRDSTTEITLGNSE